jgi:hypothetical protein
MTPNAALKRPGDNYTRRQVIDERHADSGRCKRLFGGALREHAAFDQLLVNLAIVPDPARRVTAARVAVCPVNHAPFGVPFVLAAERHNIAFAKADDSRRQIDVVRDEKRLPRRERHDEALMPAPVVVVREHPTNDALPFHLHIARVLLEGAGECLVTARECSGRWRHWGRRAADTDGAHETKDEMQVAHHDYVSEAIEPPNAGPQRRRAINIQAEG